MRGFFRGLPVLSPIVALWVVNSAVLVGSVSFDFTYAINILPIVLMEFTTGLWEEVVFRGLLMTAILMRLSPRWSQTALKRVMLVMVCGVVFGLLHHDQGLGGMMMASYFGMLFCAAYVYARNLLVLIVVHTYNNARTKWKTCLFGLIMISLTPWPSTQ